jgi:acetyltransferase-like isoleucine patch superfamily enzyme
MSYYSQDELTSLGFKQLGKDVLISTKVSFYNAANIEIGDYSRIDDFCVLSAGEGGICIGRHVHIAVFCSLIGKGRIDLADYSNLSSRVSIYSSNDDYTGEFMTNPTVPPQFTNVTHAPVRVGRHAVIGAGSVVLPGVTLHEGAGVGALSLVKKDCQRFGMYAGSPARQIGNRSMGLLEMESRFVALQNK